MPFGKLADRLKDDFLPASKAGLVLAVICAMPEQMQRPPVQVPWERKSGDEGGPKSPNVSKPDTNSLLKRLRSIDPDQSRKYRQRSGQ
jgi:hypothetical protein